MKKTPRLLILAVLVTLVLNLIPLHTGQANQAPDYTGMDLIFLVDESESILINDPQGLRFQGLTWAADWLGRLRLEKDLDQEFTFRMAVVLFGTDPVTVDFADRGMPPRYWEEIAPSSDDAWNTQLEAIENKIVAYQNLYADGLGYTDMRAAFSEARSIFDSMDARDSEMGLPGDRLKSVIMISDGVPATAIGKSGCKTPDSVHPERCSFVELIEKMVDEIPVQFPAKIYKIYALGLQDKSQIYWPAVKDEWWTITNQHSKLTESNLRFFGDIQGFLNEMVAPLNLGMGEEIIPCGRTEIDPYIKLVRFTFHKPDPSARVTIVDPYGNTVAEGESVIVRGEDSAIETVRISNPVPGYWRLECPSGVLEPPTIYQDKVKVLSTLTIPAVYQNVPFMIRYEVLGDGDKPLPEYAESIYRLNLVVSVNNSSSTSQVQLAREESQYTGSLVATVPGEYTLDLLGQTQKVTGELYTVFEDTQTIMVAPTQFGLPPGKMPHTQLVPGNIGVIIKDDKGLQVQLSEIPTAVFDASAVITAGGTSDTLSLALNEEGIFSGIYLPKQVGEITVRAKMDVQDPAGGTIQIPEMEAGKFKVDPPTAKLESPVGQQPQHVSFDLVYRFLDAVGKPYQESIDKNYRLSAKAILTYEGKPVQEVALLEDEDGAFIGEYTPADSGSYGLHVHLEALGTGGETIVLIDREEPTVSVFPTTVVSYNISKPADKSQHIWRNVLKQPNDFVVEVDLTDWEHKKILPDSVLQNKDGVPFRLSVRSPGSPTPVMMDLRTTGTPGHYRAVSKDFRALGMYTIMLEAIPTQLQADHVFDETSRQSTVEMIENPVIAFYERWKWPINTFLIALLLFLIWLFTHPFYWPATGTLTLSPTVDGAGMPQPYALNNYRKHKITIQLPSWAGGGKMKIYQARKDPSVRVTILQPKKPPVEYNMLSGQQVQVGDASLTYQAGVGGQLSQNAELTLSNW